MDADDKVLAALAFVVITGFIAGIAYMMISETISYQTSQKTYAESCKNVLHGLPNVASMDSDKWTCRK